MNKLKMCLLLVGFLILSNRVAQAKEIATDGKLITVDTKKQVLTAWDKGQIVYQTKVSTGLPKSPTVYGRFTVYKKLPLKDMSGISPYKGKYFLKDVPHVMYFYKSYAIHGTYWHKNFGRPASNGCVNVPLGTDKTLYDWTPTGTPVEIW